MLRLGAAVRGGITGLDGAPLSAAAEGCQRGDVNIPNVITVGRIFMVPLVIWLIIADRMQAAFFLFVIAGLSDALDGFLAKRFGWQTELGAYLDPIADKALLVSIYVTLGFFAHIPAWLVIAVVSRDLLIIGAIVLSWMLNRPVEVHPLYISKANTVGQIILAALVLAHLGLGLAFDALIGVVTWIAGSLTVLSAVAYLKSWLGHMTDDVTAAIHETGTVTTLERKSGDNRKPVRAAREQKRAHGQ